MHIRLMALLGFVTWASSGALAHEDGSHHSHPHLVMTNEWLAVLLGLGALALAYGAHRVLKRQQIKRNRRDTTRGHK